MYHKMWPLFFVVVIMDGEGCWVLGQSFGETDNHHSVSDDGLPVQRRLHLSKRSIPDSDCKGVYYADLWKKLVRVCRDCYNLYRKPYVSIECRRGCFESDVFRMCVGDLLLPVQEYDFYATVLREF
ncbi:crustacean hyperglycemic hormone-like [Macrobrachium rosenbergii]|uniref:crustacean hyperglycemic hormone-like n=1 Tax=Macrobrachium rosenbergii TaxID=79674 RepID=UPI0034D57CE2